MRDVQIIVTAKSIVVHTIDSKEIAEGRITDLWYHPDCTFWIYKPTKISMTILRKQTISQELMQYLQKERLSVNSLRFIGMSRPRKQKVSEKQVELL